MRCYDQCMPRLPRAVFAGVPHHITQRGNRRDDVFFTTEDRLAYLEWMHSYCQRHEVDILAYCLMTNHVHLVAVPNNEDGLQRVLKPLHMRYAQRVNKMHGWKGHLWQGRFFSSPLDDEYLWSAIRYVERNPIRVGLADRAEDYRWSSAAAHCGLRSDKVLSNKGEWVAMFASIENWSDWLSVEEEVGRLDVLRKHVEKGLPCGTDDFVQTLGRTIGRPLESRPQGRPKREGISDKG
ncbi:MAG: transposase [Zetaproteobacteria bacterium CG12_big_fil_rev_8_21_14_0_65_54_13]|nr:MAG: transposase [Zetaproteobacteria bacterium CG23_combo_of_CG06-09_8_20_14_all_54_7]PIW44094.1 MAG: transposase [Zetaproteobacteria bacterium CG12_big_fil_rev_8_21_14_0_65_54_13]